MSNEYVEDYSGLAVVRKKKKVYSTTQLLTTVKPSSVSRLVMWILVIDKIIYMMVIVMTKRVN